MKKGHTKYKKDELKLIVDNSVNYLQVIRTLGLSESGGAQQYIKKIIKILDIDTAHFLGYNTASGFKNSHIVRVTKNADELLTLGNVKVKTHQLKRALNERGVEYKCDICDLVKWLDQPITLQIHHKDGNTYNNVIENLQYLCPNCHTQTDNWGFKGKKYK